MTARERELRAPEVAAAVTELRALVSPVTCTAAEAARASGLDMDIVREALQQLRRQGNLGGADRYGKGGKPMSRRESKGFHNRGQFRRQ